MANDPQWLLWARELQSLAQTGLAFTTNPYDIERYGQLRHLASQIMATGSNTPVAIIEDLFANQTGYPTPKIDVRGAVFNQRDEILLVRETSDEGRWTLPGGWADVNITPAACVVKEIREESGYEVRVRKVAAVWDRTRQGHASRVFSCWKTFFLCDLLGGAPTASLETSEIGWFAQDAIPADLSRERTLPQQIERMFTHHRNPDLPTDFE